MRLVAMGIALAMLSGCATRQVLITGVCAAPNGVPKKGIRVTGREFRGHWFAVLAFASVLPEVRPLAHATSDDAGKFSLTLRRARGRPLEIEIKDSNDRRALPLGVRMSIPTEPVKLEELFLSVVVEDGSMRGEWRKPEAKTESTP